MTSAPAPVIRTSSPSLPSSVSSPSPPSRRSEPSPPNSTSSPSPPRRTSSPPPPQMTSSPGVPLSTSSPAVPSHGAGQREGRLDRDPRRLPRVAEADRRVVVEGVAAQVVVADRRGAGGHAEAEADLAAGGDLHARAVPLDVLLPSPSARGDRAGGGLRPVAEAVGQDHDEILEARPRPGSMLRKLTVYPLVAPGAIASSSGVKRSSTGCQLAVRRAGLVRPLALGGQHAG